MPRKMTLPQVLKRAGYGSVILSFERFDQRGIPRDLLLTTVRPLSTAERRAIREKVLESGKTLLRALRTQRMGGRLA